VRCLLLSSCIRCLLFALQVVSGKVSAVVLAYKVSAVALQVVSGKVSAVVLAYKVSAVALQVDD